MEEGYVAFQGIVLSFVVAQNPKYKNKGLLMVFPYLVLAHVGLGNGSGQGGWRVLVSESRGG